MKIAVLTSSRADFGIYLPLLKLLKEDKFFLLEIISFGTHLSKDHGYTYNEIDQEGFSLIHKIDTLPNGDNPKDISACIGNTVAKFAKFWNSNSYDLVFCLGDRYEMFAAVSAGLSFNQSFAHIHAGETTLGAIDNSFRHSISLFSDILFVTTEEYKKRAINIVGNDKDVYNVGALSIDNLCGIPLLTKDEFFSKFGIDMNLPTILSTFHPETINFNKNIFYIDELLSVFSDLLDTHQIIITLPNNDTMGNEVRKKIKKFKKENDSLIVVESFGVEGYLSCMKHSLFLLGNTSSGFVEASFFSKPVINLGDRQKGRIVTKNIINTNILKDEIIKSIEKINSLDLSNNNMFYGDGKSAEKIIKIIKEKYGNK
tara:strand:+ start:1361 stop:2473 length:1113 start_codon:yes stop_codon:yes gene_type:complete